jgi:hypothetical protein
LGGDDFHREFFNAHLILLHKSRNR